jgi:hypothetical protein
MRHLRNVFAFTAIVVLVLPSCNLPFGLGGDDAEDRLESNWEKWRRRGPADYDLTLNKSCECLPPGTVRISVRNDVRTAVIDPASGEPVAENLVSQYPTIPELFELIEDALDRDPHQLEVTYHDHFGYPTLMVVDYRENVADDEFVISVESFVER